MTHGVSNAWQALKEFDGGTFGLRTGLIPIRLGGYLLPWSKDTERLHNRDIKRMTFEQLDAETKAMRKANDAIEKLKAQGLRTINIPKKRGATSWDEWYKERLKAVNERIRG